MGKASSGKKVARAAGMGGSTRRRRNTPWGYLVVVGLIVVLGVAGTVASRNHRLAEINGQGNSPPTVGTVWNEGYAVYACGKFLPPISSDKDPQGIHTSSPGDGIIHISPTVKAAAGKNATLGKFSSAVGMKLNAAELQVPGGTLYQDGNSCEGSPGHVYVRQFAYVGDKIGKLANVDPRDIHLSDQELLTIAFVPASDKSKIPPPPQSVQDALQKLAVSSTTTTLPSTSTTAAGATTTTAAATTTTTTSGAATTTTTVKK